MGKVGYACVIAVIVALGVYVFWPSGGTGEAVVVYRGEPQADFRLKANGLDQRVDGQTVQINGLELPLDHERSNQFWNQVRRLEAPPEKVLSGIGEPQLSAYGIDGSRMLTTTETQCAVMQWGSAGGIGYVWNSSTRQLFALPKALTDSLDQHAGRLDDPTLVTFAGELARIEVGGLALVRQGGDYQAEGHPERPGFLLRVQRLAQLAGGLKLLDLLGGAPAPLAPIATIRLHGSGSESAKVQTILLYPGGLIQVDRWPIQTLGPAGFAAWSATVASFADDHLFNINQFLIGNPVERVLIERSGKEWFRLDRRGIQNQNDGQSQWDLVWSGGRETAAPDCAQRLVDAFNALTVSAVHQRSAAAPATAALVIRLTGGQHAGDAVLELSGDQAASPTHQGTIKECAPLLRQLTPDALLDATIVGRRPERVLKIQRRIHDERPERQEVFTRRAGGAWQQTWPGKAAADHQSLDQLSRAICQARALAVRLVTDADRAILAAPDLEVDVRFAAKPVGKANDAAAIDDTTPRDWGLAIRREADGWRAVDKEGSVSYLIDNDLVDSLRQPLIDDLAFPLVPSLCQRLDVSIAGQRYALVRDGGDWLVQVGDGVRQPADAVQVRRYLRLLSTLHAQRSDRRATPLPVGDQAGSVTCLLPGVDAAPERLTLIVGKPGGDGTVALTVESSLADTGVPSGRAWVAADLAGRLLPAAAGFLPVGGAK